jgi:hypothetical protein
MFLEAHKGLDVDEFVDRCGHRSSHVAGHRNHAPCLRLLIDTRADLEQRDDSGLTPLSAASAWGSLECVKMLIENKADVHSISAMHTTAAHHAAGQGHAKCLEALIDAKADVNASSIHGFTPIMYACAENRLSCLQLLVDNEGDALNVSGDDFDALYAVIIPPTDIDVACTPGITFAVLSCNTDSKSVVIDEDVTRAIVNAHIKEYRQIQTFIDEWHGIAKHALAEDIEVDKRVGRHGHGLYHEALESTLQYLGLSLGADQTVNTSIDGKNKTRALIQRHPTNANLWFDLHQRTR